MKFEAKNPMSICSCRERIYSILLRSDNKRNQLMNRCPEDIGPELFVSQFQQDIPCRQVCTRRCHVGDI